VSCRIAAFKSLDLPVCIASASRARAVTQMVFLKSSTRAGRLFLRQKTSPSEAIKGKSPECSGLQLDVFWEAALPVGKAAAIEVRLSSETLAVT
jgi:hypothetical protein